MARGIDPTPTIATVQLQPARPVWRRALWMRLGAVNGLVALFVLLSSQAPMLTPDQAAAIRFGAQIQFMHGMATIACATFLNIGARGARLAPAFFRGGILLYCLPTYGQAAGAPGWFAAIKPVGLAAFTVGWAILAWSAGEIDQG